MTNVRAQDTILTSWGTCHGSQRSLFSLCRGLAAMDVVSFTYFFVFLGDPSWVQTQASMHVFPIFSLILSSLLNGKYCSVNLSYNQRLLFPCLQYKIKLTPFNFLSIMLFLHTTHLLLSYRCSLNKLPWMTSSIILMAISYELYLSHYYRHKHLLSWTYFLQPLPLCTWTLSLLPPLHFKLNSL